MSLLNCHEGRLGSWSLISVIDEIENKALYLCLPKYMHTYIGMKTANCFVALWYTTWQSLTF